MKTFDVEITLTKKIRVRVDPEDVDQREDIYDVAQEYATEAFQRDDDRATCIDDGGFLIESIIDVADT